jgi:Asp-tRNA(Asn)/Glu-tRNA(Gln) amidotransferase A subunit family amidase
MKPPTYFSIAELLHSYSQKELSPVEVVTAHLERVRKLQPELNAFVHLDGESAIAKAREAEAAIQRGEKILALQGIPLTIKSSMDVAGWPCPAGSLLRKDYVPTKDAIVVARLEAAGAILLGNTNTPEFLMAYETNNRVSGKTSNPWNLAYSSGGSSGGEAAAIASGCSMGGIGSDGGGSIRVPAHFCGVCGLKPTPGRIAATGHYPPGSGAFGWIGVVGPMARTAGEVRALFNVMVGPDLGDALSAPVPVREVPAGELRGLRVGILESPALGTATEETQRALIRAGKLLEEQGFRVEYMPLRELDRALELWWFFFGPVIGKLIKEATKGQEELLSPMLREYLGAAAESPPLTLESFMESCVDRDLVREDILRQMGEVGVLLSPVSAKPAFPHGAGNYQRGDPHNYRDTMRYCQWMNLTGFPGMSVPMWLSPEGLPINVQLIGRPYGEEILLSVAEKLEKARGKWHAPEIQVGFSPDCYPRRLD